VSLLGPWRRRLVVLVTSRCLKLNFCVCAHKNVASLTPPSLPSSPTPPTPPTARSSQQRCPDICCARRRQSQQPPPEPPAVDSPPFGGGALAHRPPAIYTSCQLQSRCSLPLPQARTLPTTYVSSISDWSAPPPQRGTTRAQAPLLCPTPSPSPPTTTTTK